MSITLVTGPPCVGKSTHVQANAQPGDIVIDLDAIALALSAPGVGHHDYDDTTRAVAIAARQAAIDAALATDRHVWIISAIPSAKQLAYYQAKGATIVTLDAPADVIAERLAQRPQRNQALVASLEPTPAPRQGWKPVAVGQGLKPWRP